MPDLTLAPARRLLPLAALGIVALYVFLVWPALGGPFVFDDFPNLAALGKYAPIDSWEKLGLYLSEARHLPGRPLAMLSFLPQQADWPQDPFPFKLMNLVIHLANTGLLFLLFARLLRHVAAVPAPRRPLVAALAATAWLVHPIQISAEMLVIQRMTLLSGSFVLLGLLAYVHGLTASGSTPRRRGAWMGIGIGLGTGLAILCKENGVLLPLLAWIIDACLLREAVRALPPSLRTWRRLLLFPAIALLAGYLLSWLGDPFTVLPTRGFSVFERLLSQPRVLFDYLGDIAFPRYAQFGVFHDDIVVSRGLLTPATTLASWAGIAAASAVAWIARKKRPLLAFAIFWYLGAHALEAGPVPLELYFEHRNYLPLAGLAFAAIAGIASLPDGALQRAGWLAFAVWLSACLFADALYARVWSSEDRLTYFWAAAHPDSVRSQSAYASALLDAGMLDGAKQILAGSRRRGADDVGLDLSEAMVDCRMRTLTPAALDALQTRLRHARWSQFGVETMDGLRMQATAGECPALTTARWLRLSDALLANPVFHDDGFSAGKLHYQRHSLAVADGDLERTLAELDEVAKREPDPEIPRLKAKYLVEAGLPDEAIAVLSAYDPGTRPLLRRLLVDDVAINREAIAKISAGAGAKRP